MQVVKRVAVRWIHARGLKPVLFAAALLAATHAFAQQPLLDSAADATKLAMPAAKTLTEEFVWTAGDAAALRPDHDKFTYRDTQKKTEPHFFRREFNLPHVPAQATLYIAGPRIVRVFLNGQLVLDAHCDESSPLNTHVYSADGSKALRPGKNVLAIEAVRGRGIVAASDSPLVQQVAFGEVLTAKIVAAERGLPGTVLAKTDADWRSTLAAGDGWQKPEFDDSSWTRVQSLGPIESRIEFRQWNLDAGLYDWPGYMGLSPALRTYTLLPAKATLLTPNAQAVEHLDALTQPRAEQPFAVQATASGPVEVMLDFGKEVAGRLLVESRQNATMEISYGESEAEALSGKNYLGVNPIFAPANEVARGPKSGFRYVLLRFKNEERVAFRQIRLEGIAYPVEYKGSFESSDEKLNRIWQTAAYTVHLCMQDGVWDAPKRDRGWWVGDLDASTAAIDAVFADNRLLNETLTHLQPPVGKHVNGIPSYTGLWIETVASIYRRDGDRRQLAARQEELHTLLEKLVGELEPDGSFVNRKHRWLFVDWSPQMFAYDDAAQLGTAMEIARALRDGAWLMEELGDRQAATQYKAQAAQCIASVRTRLKQIPPEEATRWQLSTMAVLSGAAQKNDFPALWQDSFRSIEADDKQTQTISPYFNWYLLEALTRMEHRQQALDWLRRYWGGMLDEGATSFWEAYDLNWPKTDPHQYLQADGKTGFFVSLAHGWSAGPAAWLEENVLGVRALSPGYRQVEIRPELLGLKWAKGRVPTPQGAIAVELLPDVTTIELPADVQARVLVAAANGKVLVNGKLVKTEATEEASRRAVELNQAGRYRIVPQL
ncbi:alpha-L-rhamnosidase C-terminal domain-containing protein [Telmatobacter bradus]|uniref:alpha-L-rhamnosidase-related protein n=1 Tax=Telmatobacter bradus TaxID=474953 RepID=UPI003B4345DF